jgi:hypothetical protein
MGAVRLIFSILARNKGKKPTHTTINWMLVLPAMLSHLRCLEPAHHVVGDAVSAQIGTIRPRGPYDRLFPSLHEIRQKKANTHDNQLVAHSRPHPSPARSVVSEPRATSRATRCRLIWFHLRRGWRTTSAFIIIAQIRQKKAPPHNNQQSVARPASHVPLLPDPASLTREPHCKGRGVCLNRYNLTDGGCAIYFSILA